MAILQTSTRGSYRWAAQCRSLVCTNKNTIFRATGSTITRCVRFSRRPHVLGIAGGSGSSGRPLTHRPLRRLRPQCRRCTGRRRTSRRHVPRASAQPSRLRFQRREPARHANTTIYPGHRADAQVPLPQLLAFRIRPSLVAGADQELVVPRPAVTRLVLRREPVVERRRARLAEPLRDVVPLHRLGLVPLIVLLHLHLRLLRLRRCRVPNCHPSATVSPSSTPLSIHL